MRKLITVAFVTLSLAAGALATVAVMTIYPEQARAYELYGY